MKYSKLAFIVLIVVLTIGLVSIGFGQSKKSGGSSRKPSSSSRKPSGVSKPPVSKPPASKPSTNKSSETTSSRKPISSPQISEKAKAAKQEESRRIYMESKSTPVVKNPPVQKESKPIVPIPSVESKPIVKSKPIVIQNELPTNKKPDVYVENRNYRQPSSWYHSQPSINVGGGYSSAFWWMMSEWSAERRALWLYNNQNVIEKEAYERGLKDAEVAAKIAELKNKNTPINSQYVDPEFVSDTSVMYAQNTSQKQVQPNLNSQQETLTSMTFWLILLSVSLICFGAYYLIFCVRWGK